MSEDLNGAGAEAFGGVGEETGGTTETSAKPKGKGRRVAAKVQTKIDTVAERLSDQMTKVAEETRTVYGRATERAQQVAQRVEPFAAERPYATIGIAAVVGFLMGALLTRGGPKVIYLKPRD
jgi:ElaB/YqjD/DUF883 family membrane-anchored ribosome-binding protein